MMRTPKPTKDIQQNDKNLWQKTTIEFSEQVCPKQNNVFFLSTVVLNDSFASKEDMFSISHLAYRLIYSLLYLGEKLKHSETFTYLNTDILFYNAKKDNSECRIVQLQNKSALNSP